MSATTTTSKIFVSKDYHQDLSWYVVDNYTLSRLQPPSRPNSASLQETLANSAKRGLMDISAFPTQAKFMALQSQLGNVKNALEVGIFGG
jgi:predicted O-methyltransferase YrrM